MFVSRIIKDFSEFKGLLPVWEELLAHSPSNTVFLSHPYLATWWKHFGEGKHFFVVLIEESGSLVAAAPFSIRPAHILGSKIRTLEIIGTGPVPTRPMGLSDRADLLARNGNEDALLETFKVLLSNRAEWDLIHLKGVCFKENRLPAVLKQLLPGNGVNAHAVFRYRSPYLPLAGMSFEEYTKRRSRNFRKHLASDRKKLLSLGPLEVERGEKWHPDAIINEAHKMYLKSWKGARGSGLFLNPKLREFFKDLFAAFQEREWLLARFLKSGENRIAHEICFQYADKLYSYDSCFDSGYASFSPGEMLTASILEEFFPTGLREYDMLRGDEPYKTRWSKTMREEYEIAIAPPGPRSAVYRLIQMRLKSFVRGNRFLNKLDDQLSAFYHQLFTNR